MSVLTSTHQSYAQEQAEEIYDKMVNLMSTEYSIQTSDRIDKKQHGQFPRIANELRKKGLKVRSKDNWGTTEWTVYI